LSAPPEILARVHGSCVLLAGAGIHFGAPPEAGVLLLGDSGAGKSDVALRLIEAGAMLVADDQTELYARNGGLMARAPERLAGLLEIRGIGILQMSRAETARVTLCVVLEASPAARLPEQAYYSLPQELMQDNIIRIPLLRIDPRQNSAPAKIAAAVAGYANGMLHGIHENSQARHA